MKTIADKIAELGGELAPAASSSEIAQLEARIGYALPIGLVDLLKRHNGSVKETDEAIWRFWPCSEIKTHSDYRGSGDFCPDNNDLRTIDSSARAVRLPGSRVILFADALIDAPTYGIFHSPGHRYDGFVFDCSMGYLSAESFEDWIAAFIDHGEDGLLFPETKEPEQGVAPQSATRPESKSEGRDKPQPESEGRSR